MAVLKYEEIAESLRARIAAGEIAPGETIPSGRELAEQWDVSRATAIKAVDVLRNDGVVVAKQGTGFVVTETPVARPAGARRAGSARILGGMPFLRVGAPDWAEPPAHVATALRLTAGTKALRRVRVLQLPDGTPNSCVEAWFPQRSPRSRRALPTRIRLPKEQRATSDARPDEGHPKVWTSPPCVLHRKQKRSSSECRRARRSPYCCTRLTTSKGSHWSARRA